MRRSLKVFSQNTRTHTHARTWCVRSTIFNTKRD